MKFDHIGFITRDIASEIPLFESLHGPLKWSPLIEDPLQDVMAKFGASTSGIIYELLQPLSVSSPIAVSLAKKVNIIHHICYRTNDLASTRDMLRKQGSFPVTEPKPAVAFGGEMLQFFYQPGGWLLEIIGGTAGPFDEAMGSKIG